MWYRDSYTKHPFLKELYSFLNVREGFIPYPVTVGAAWRGYYPLREFIYND